jgi:hypothetical protein
MQCHMLQEGYFKNSRRFCADSNSKSSNPLFPSGRPCKRSRRSSVSNICLDNMAIPSELPLVSRSFEQFKVASVRTLFRVREDSSVLVHPSGRRGNTIRMPVRIRGELGLLSQTRIRKDNCIRPDDKSTPSGR